MHSNRITIIENKSGIQLNIAHKKPLFTVSFMIIWLCGWAFGEWAIGTILLTNNELPMAVMIFSIVWLTGWTWGGYKAIKGLLRILFGQQIIHIN